MSSVNAGALTAPPRAKAGLVTTGLGVGDGGGAGGGGGTVCVGGSSGVGGAGGMVNENTGAVASEGDPGTSASGSEASLV